MNPFQPSSLMELDTTNPGHIISCCGVLELAHRMWPGAEGWFEGSQFLLSVPQDGEDNVLRSLIDTLTDCEIFGLSKEELNERDKLEKEVREMKRQRLELSSARQMRRRELGKRARTGLIGIGEPFAMILNWWESQTGDQSVSPKTWAGSQEVRKIARAAQDSLLEIGDLTRMLDYGCVLNMPKEYQGDKSGDKKVEPFYFDARRFSHSLDTGFSLDVQKVETIAYPAVELLCLIGLQRFRPVASSVRGRFDYWTWSSPMAAPVAAAVFSGLSPVPGSHVAAAVFSGLSPVPGSQAHSFRLRYRDDQKRYKAFDFTTSTGGAS